MSRLLVGLDLNGRADVAARDRALDDPDTVLEVPLIVAGGLGSDIVLAGRVSSQGSATRRIAGPQARMAPHGRGDGWGQVGAAALRRSLATALDAPERDGAGDDIRAAVDAMARGAREIVLAVPDLPSFDEAQQGQLIRMIRAGRGPQVRLLWRSVAAFLDLLDQGLIPRDRPGAAWDILVHGSFGIEVQRLTLVDDPLHPGHVAPRRDGPGTLMFPEFGLDPLLDRAREMVKAANATIAWDRCEQTRLGPAILSGVGGAGDIEILRTWNSTWTAVTAPKLEPDGILPDCVSAFEPEPGANGSFLVTPLAAPFAISLARRLQQSWPELQCVQHAAVARGALRAGRLIERGLPHYYDRIEPIRIAVQRADEPEFTYLIGPDVIVPADKEYISPPLEGFDWPRDKRNVEFYILKGDKEVRHWTAEKERGPDRSVPVVMQVRQTPGQSWARLSVTSDQWDELSRAPVTLDWETIAALDKTPEQVIESLRHPPPGIPDRIVERPHVALWFGGGWAGNGAGSLLARIENSGREVPLARWQSVLSSSRTGLNGEKFWLVGTDGDLPAGLPDDVRAGFQSALSRAEAILLGANPLRDNAALQTATWCFAGCPEAVQDALVDAWAALHARRPHRFLQPAAGIAVVKQGTGRSVTGAARIRQILKLIMQSELNHHDVSALAMILTRRAEAPEAMTREIVDDLAPRLGKELLKLKAGANFQQKFRATLQAVGGLFRWRVRESHALLAAREPVASQLRDTLVAVGEMIGRPEFAATPALPRKQQIVGELIEFLDGRGDPDILRKIENA